jgi:DNA-binding SARP family transcriptional activator
MLSIDLLGPLRISPSPGKLPKKCRAMLAYLAMNPGQVGRATLADMFWPYQGTEQSRHSLRNALLEMRRYLPDAALHLYTDFSTVELIGAECDLDAWAEAIDRSDRASFENAVAIWRGPLLEGIEIQSEPWNEWLESRRRQLQGLMEPVLLQLAESASRCGDHDAAISFARRLVRAEPYDENALRLLMTALAAAGQRLDAIAEFKRSSEIIARELSCAPDEETLKLASELGCKEIPAAVKFMRLKPAAHEADDELCMRISRLRVQMKDTQGERRVSRKMLDAIEQALEDALHALRKNRPEWNAHTAAA